MGDDNGDRARGYTMRDCPFCDAAGPHYPGDDGQFGCATCNMWFGSSVGEGKTGLGPSWLPRP